MLAPAFGYMLPTANRQPEKWLAVSQRFATFVYHDFYANADGFQRLREIC